MDYFPTRDENTSTKKNSGKNNNPPTQSREISYPKTLYFIVRRSQNWIEDSQVAATAFTSCGSQAPPDK